MKSKEYFPLPANAPARFVFLPLIVAILAGGFYLIFMVRGDYQTGRETLKKLPVFSYFIKQRDSALIQARLMDLRFNAPNFESLSQYIQETRPIPDDTVIRYQKYFLKVVEANPYIAEAQGALGLLYNLRKEHSVAFAYYSNAAFLKPEVFWFNYNLALLYFENGDCQNASAYFKKAADNSAEETLKFIYSSGIYYKIISAYKSGKNFSVEESLKKGYSNAYLLLSICHEKITGNELDIPKSKIQLDNLNATAVQIAPKML